MNTLPLIAILHGAIPPDAPEDELDTLHQVQYVTEALTALGYRVAPVPLTLNLAEAGKKLQALHPLLVFNMVDSIECRGTLAPLAFTLLEHLQMPFTGSPSYATCTTTDKLLCKRLLHGAGIPTPEWIEPDAVATLPALEGEYIIKSLMEDGSIGLTQESVVTTPDAMRAVIKDRTERYGGLWFAERYIDGREFDITILETPDGIRALAPAEMEFTNRPAGARAFFDYTVKWLNDNPDNPLLEHLFDFPASDAPLLARLTEMALRCWRLFQLEGYGRVDFRVDANGNPYVLEINVNPCLIPGCIITASGERSGYDYNQFIGAVVNAAKRRFGLP